MPKYLWLTDGLLADNTEHVLRGLHWRICPACHGGGQVITVPQDVAKAEGDNLPGSYISYGTGKWYIFLFLILLSCLFVKFLITYCRWKIQNSLLENLWFDSQPDLAVEYSMAVISVSIFLTGFSSIQNSLRMTTAPSVTGNSSMILPNVMGQATKATEIVIYIYLPLRFLFFHLFRL